MSYPTYEDLDARYLVITQKVTRIDAAASRVLMVARIHEKLTREYGPEEYASRLKIWIGEMNIAADALIQTTSPADAWDWGFRPDLDKTDLDKQPC